MSTISKLDYRVREARSERAGLIRNLAQMESEAIKAGDHKLAALVVGGHDFLQKVRRSSWRTGAEKQKIFIRVAKEIANA